MIRIAILVTALTLPSTAWAINVGEKAPDFRLKDANGKEYRLSSFKRKILTVFYEGSQSRNQNKWLKQKYKQLRLNGRINRSHIETIAIANFRESPLPNAVVRTAIRLKVSGTKKTVLLDETGKLQQQWGFRNGRSNIYVFDQNRRLIWKSSGPMTKKRARQFLRFLRRMSIR